ncbi:hypothetical protein Calab_1353 [Caldithrix abyssi DSM 13497]|uniref:Uncharacterized protein n=1 Tax=Caldithrix abyssi DSM 13497 TaxID=880073 RepID=H1XNY4_CALAY|nr:hypothetical protein Calab_1353 [Caldithrix abyssi DSM 13497]
MKMVILLKIFVEEKMVYMRIPPRIWANLERPSLIHKRTIFIYFLRSPP